MNTPNYNTALFLVMSDEVRFHYQFAIYKILTLCYTERKVFYYLRW